MTDIRTQPLKSIKNSIESISDNNFESGEVQTVLSDGYYEATTKNGSLVKIRSQADLVIGNTVRYRTKSLTVVDKITPPSTVNTFDV